MSALLLAFERRGGSFDTVAFELALAALGDRGPLRSEHLDPAHGGIAVRELQSARAGAGGPALAGSRELGVALALDGRIDRWARGEPESPESTRPDAGRLLARYLERGEGFLDGITGSFALVLLDSRAPLALVARDGLGNRYLSYSLDTNRLLVASDDSALLAFPGVRPDLDPLRLTEFYGSAELSGNETFHLDVRALLPGEMLVADRVEVRRRRFDRIDPAARILLSSWEEYVEAFAERLRAAVERRLRGVSRAAVWLSGGLDSGPIAALAARHLGTAAYLPRLLGLCWQVGHAAGEEIAWAESVGSYAGFPVEPVPCADADPFQPLELWQVRASTPEQTAYRWYHERSYERARSFGAEVVLWGFGGDMLYAAPRRWFWDLAAADGVGRALDRLREAAAARGWRRVVRSELLAPVIRRRPAAPRAAASWLTAEAAARLADRPVWPPHRESARRPHQAERLLALLDGFGVSVEQADAARHGLELRTPLRDRDLVELALAVPDHLLLQGAETRPVLRAAARGLLPEAVRTRRGKGDFSAAVVRALLPAKRPWARALLEHPEALWRGIVEAGAIARWLERCPTGGAEDLGFCQAIYGELWRRKRRGEDLRALDQPTP